MTHSFVAGAAGGAVVALARVLVGEGAGSALAYALARSARRPTVLGGLGFGLGLWVTTLVLNGLLRQLDVGVEPDRGSPGGAAGSGGRARRPGHPNAQLHAWGTSKKLPVGRRRNRNDV
ncbi:MAG: hypothetical protein AB1645_09265 [Bacillota bacterium]|jgi:hypothetical protein